MTKLLFAALFLLLSSASARAQADFYKGKTVRIVIGYSAGGTNDLWARAIARHWGKYVPGNPNIIVQNMPGAGTMVAANYVYSVEKPDGLTLALIAPGLFFNQLGGQKEVKFDWAKFTWIGSPEETSEMLSMRSDAPFKTLDDIRQAAVPPKCGTTGAGTPGHYFPRLLEEVLGLKFDLVTGYPGAADVDLAIEKGEVQCRAGTTSAFFGREPGRTWAKTGFVRILVIGGAKRDPRAPEVPTIWELMEKYKTPEFGKRLATVLLSPGSFGRPIVGGPGIPADRVKILRESFLKAMKDPELLAEAEKRGWEPDPVAGEKLQALAREVVTQPPEVIARMNALLAK
ncbi:MAG TPA: tripartite tricarboxylate transporter substrate-binding protein [Candidatus Acidoferrales bacterium]|nr:tripartite tricarboxylate transporter substrate-binding protein [Candidatus Acidoferrales bacterium]